MAAGTVRLAGRVFEVSVVPAAAARILLIGRSLARAVFQRLPGGCGPGRGSATVSARKWPREKGCACLRPLLDLCLSELHAQRQPVHSWRAEISIQRTLLIHGIENELCIVLIEEILCPRLDHPPIVL